MKKSFMMFVGIVLFSIVQAFSPSVVAQAAAFENGTYSVSFELKEAGNNNTSIADGYFSKPATLVVKNGVNYIQMTTTQSDWIKSMSGPKGSATVISESGNSRTVQFEAGDLTKPVNMKMHVVVPEDVAGMKYDHHHSVRAVFNVSGVPAATATPEKKEESTAQAQQDKGASQNTAEASGADQAEQQVDNPKTGDTSPIWLYVALLIGSIGVFTVYKTRVAKN